MAVGQMQFGADNDAGSGPTRLTSTAAGTTLSVDNTGTVGVWQPAYAIAANGKTAGVSSQGDTYGVEGSSVAARGIGVAGSGFTGVQGHTWFDDPSSVGVYGRSIGLNSNGVIGEANNGSAAYGVWGRSTSGYAGKFTGKVDVTGTLTKGVSQFRIDHPLDPENRWLLHAAVESPERLNIYSGTVVTDAEGAAVVALPEYFEALNADFRYQLTVVGDFAHAVVSEEVRNNSFAIATDRPEVKVSWQVSGIRQDLYAQANPLVVEEEKPEEERGTYLHPEAWGKPPEAGAEYARIKALEERRPQVPSGDPVPPDTEG
ncbi:hypothetical protein [Streptomyces sp. NPDC006668]|uniref:hypothetical protein n=1 Tax=Streptomyces sp. NPDC006668 TaxID=3156903 RepID=UPI0033FD2C3C